MSIDHSISSANCQMDKPRSKNVTNEKGSEPASFETAIAATGFGKFNIFLMLAIVPTAFAQVFENTSMSYVLPVAHCDLNLSLEDKGMLNSMSFAGMIASGFIWGYLCDSFGRRKIMIYGYLLDGFFVLMSSISQNISMLMIAKFFGGFIINGPFSAAASYLSEFHASHNRAKVQLVRGVFVTLANIVLPLLAWSVLPKNFSFVLFQNIGIRSWNVFLFICAIAPLTGGIIFIFMPESPRFLMSQGRNEEALSVFQKVYRINTGKSILSFPITRLVQETTEIKKNNNQLKKITLDIRKLIQEIIYRVKPLFYRPYARNLALVCFNSFLFVMGVNTLRLWMPQLFQAINDYQFTHNGSSSSMCDMLEVLVPKKTEYSSVCVVNLDNSSVYTNSIIIGIAQIMAFAVAGIVVNHFGKKKIAISMAFTSSCCVMSIYFTQNSESVLALSSIFFAFSGVAVNLLLTMALEMFPTSLRTIALSLDLMSLRIGSIVGNNIFPILLMAGCAPPFFFIGTLCCGSMILTAFYPNTENKELQ